MTSLFASGKDSHDSDFDLVPDRHVRSETKNLTMTIEDLFEALPEAVYTTDAEGRINYFNEAAADMWGVRPELGKSEF
jgi:PAS domain-containing protein